MCTDLKQVEFGCNWKKLPDFDLKLFFNFLLSKLNLTESVLFYCYHLTSILVSKLHKWQNSLFGRRKKNYILAYKKPHNLFSQIFFPQILREIPWKVREMCRFPPTFQARQSAPSLSRLCATIPSRLINIHFVERKFRIPYRFQMLV